jgi:hypothetical protein
MVFSSNDARGAAHYADGQIVVLVDRTLAAERGDDRDVERLCEPRQFAPGLRDDHAFAGDEQRTFRLDEAVDDRRHDAWLRRNAARIDDAERFLPIDRIAARIGAEHVGRDLEMDRTGRGAGRDSDRRPHHRGGTRCMRDRLVPPNDRRMHRDTVEFLILEAVPMRHRDRRGQRDDGASGPQRIRHRTGDVGDTGPALAVDEARPARDAGIAIGHVDRASLAAAVDDLDAGVVQGDPEVMVAAHQAEEFLRAIGDQCLSNHLGDCRHARVPRRSFTVIWRDAKRQPLRKL